MNQPGAVALAAELASAYPGRGIGELTLTQYAAALQEAEPEAAVLAVGDLVRAFPERAPTLGQVREALRIRDAFAQRELPDVTYRAAEAIPMPAEIAAKYHRIVTHADRILAMSEAEETERARESEYKRLLAQTMGRLPGVCSGAGQEIGRAHV